MKLLILEFNEIEPGLIDRGIAQGRLPAFDCFRDAATRYTTEAPDSLLEPWVQWVTLHTGVSLREHGAVQLAQGPAVPQPFIWERVAAAGHGCWICGAMNTREHPDLAGRLIPDYWTLPATDSPFMGFSGFVNACVSRPIESRHRVPWSAGLRFAGFMMRNGLRPATIGRSSMQLVQAILGRTPWRVVFVLEECQLDLFVNRTRKLKPDLGLFFVNSVAHLQHNYWREMQPELFDDAAPAERRRHRHAIDEGYRHLDRLLARLLDSVGNETTILLCSALGQQPYQGDENRGAVLYRVKNLKRLISAVSLPEPRRELRLMADSFTLEYQTPTDAEHAASRLRELQVDSRSLFEVRLSDANRVLVDVGLTHETPGVSPLKIAGSDTAVRLEDLLEIGHYKSGEHHPRGLLWVRGEFPRLTERPAQSIPLTAVAPAIARFFGLPVQGDAS